ncbi:MAG: outer membrane beta-barrel protein [Bacteroidota bacterium]|nr:outer membrane beta-barrel protein [Candidatus Kapabacteria bacterium]MDW8219631.1 outer membrane beta-barrel protein [Bacteroidota bacterium]
MHAQSTTITIVSSVVDSITRSAITGARIQLLRLDSSLVTGTVADRNGTFTLRGIPPGQYILSVQSIGYTTLTSKITVSLPRPGVSDTLRLPPFRLAPSAVRTGEVEVSTTALRAEVRGDTTEYTASSFKTDKNAVAEDIIRKMPGIEIDASGTVKAQGENVRRVLVDGKPFFGDDPSAALKNLPSEIIERIQVIDQMSDQAAFTRFDDGDRTKTLNIITNPAKRMGQFGKVYAGYGSNTQEFESRYTAGGNINFFHGDTRISLLGMTNNINQQNFSIQDILGLLGTSGGMMGNAMRMMGSGGAAAMRSIAGGGGAQMFRMRAGGSSSPGDFLVPQSDGITAAHGLGINYSDQWSKNVSATGSYFVNFTNNDAEQLLQRQYFLTENVPPQTSKQGAVTNTQNMNHRINMRIEATLDSSHSVILTPRLTLQTNNRTSFTERATFVGGFNGSLRPLNTTEAESSSQNFGYSLGGDILWRYKFPVEGRTLSINLSPSYNYNIGRQLNNSTNGFASPLTGTLTLNNINQETPILGNTVGFGANISYTEPLHDKGSLQASYNLNWTASVSDRQVFDFNATEGAYTDKNILLSNVFSSSYITHRPGITYRYAFATEANVSVGVEYQAALLNVAQQEPQRFSAFAPFHNILPNASLTVRFGRTGNLRLNYRTFTNAPSIRQLQNVLDFTDPLRLYLGNPNLNQEYTHSIFANYGTFDMASAHSMFFFVGINITQDRIANAVTIVSRDTLILPEVSLAAGGQFTRPINIATGVWSGRAFATYGFPWEIWEGAKLNINLSSGLTYSRDISFINGLNNNVDNLSIAPSLTVSSNISENLDFTLSGRTTVTLARNSLQSALDNTFLIHNAYARLNWVFWEGFLLSSDFTYISNNGLADGFNQSIPLLSIGIGKRFLDDKLEVKLSAFDALNQNTSIARNVTSTYIEDAQTAVLQRYVLLTFTYNLRAFGGNSLPPFGGTGMFPPLPR